MSDFRKVTRDRLDQIWRASPDNAKSLAGKYFSHECSWEISEPVGHLVGPQSVLENFILPVRKSLSNLHRRDEIFIGGMNRRADGEHWVASLVHYVGNFTTPLFGINPSNRLVFLRAGEFYRIEGGMIVEARLIVDLVDLMRQVGRLPLPAISGTEMLFPGPATHDGILPEDPLYSALSLDLVEAMLGDLKAFDPETFSSAGQTGNDGYWHDDMLWYGPGGVGSNFRWEGFERDHRKPFLTAFPDRVGGNHFCRIGDGNYAAVSGWPSMTMTHLGDYLGVQATGKTLTLRVMDFYRCTHKQGRSRDLSGSKIMENWVCLDYLDLFSQMGIDLVERSAGMD